MTKPNKSYKITAMPQEAKDRRSNLNFMEIQINHNSIYILILGTLYALMELIGLSLAHFGFFESDIKVPVFIILCFHILYIPLLALSYKGIILKKPKPRLILSTIYPFIMIFWGSLLNVLSYMQSSDTSVYSIVIVVMAALILSPRISVSFFLGGFVFFSLMVLQFDTELTDANAMIFKALIVTLLGIGLSRITYKNRLRLYESEKNLLQANARLRDISLRDSMTGLFNNSYIYDFLKKALEVHQGRKGTLGVMMLDLDHFKAINDNHGHLVGDVVLQKVSETMLRCTRDSDMVGRYGGEEFIIILTETNADKASAVAERIREQVEALTFEQGFSVTCSIGLALYNGSGEIDLIARADALMYEAKNTGRNRVVY